MDRLELRLALFEYDGWVYTLTFDNQHLPEKFDGVRKLWRSFLRRLDLWHDSWSKDYIYCIEGKHGDHRYHIHVVLRYREFSPAEVRHLWKYGMVEETPLLRGPHDTYRRTAKYLSKEATDGITIPISARTWVCSKALVAKLPPMECWRDTTGHIDIPQDCRCHGTYSTNNEFGQYRYAWHIAQRWKF